ncbi:putative Pre-ATP-grasp domain superfamily protein [Helianthus anomalus]
MAACSSLSTKLRFDSSTNPRIQPSDVVFPASVAVNRKSWRRSVFRGIGIVRSEAVAVDDRKVEGESEKRREKGRVLKVGLICGGPSAERGISLNSARSVLDHIQVFISSILVVSLFKKA